jgi:hypothetical protein
MPKCLWQVKMLERDHLEDPEVEWIVISKRNLEKYDKMVSTGLIWLRTWTTRGMLWKR